MNCSNFIAELKRRRATNVTSGQASPAKLRPSSRLRGNLSGVPASARRSNAQRAVDGLLDRDVIDRENGSYLITDRFFRLWVQRVQLP